jgi:hypothetical protein
MIANSMVGSRKALLRRKSCVSAVFLDHNVDDGSEASSLHGIEADLEPFDFSQRPKCVVCLSFRSIFQYFLCLTTITETLSTDINDGTYCLSCMDPAQLNAFEATLPFSVVYSRKVRTNFTFYPLNLNAQRMPEINIASLSWHVLPRRRQSCVILNQDPLPWFDTGTGLL